MTISTDTKPMRDALRLQDAKAFASFSVPDLDVAERFYGETLGLNVARESCGLTLKLAGGFEVYLYPKSNHTPASFTVLNFPVPDIEVAVRDLGARGIRFEQYGGKIQTDEKGIFRGSVKGEGPDIAWFKDPAGNILAVMAGE